MGIRKASKVSSRQELVFYMTSFVKGCAEYFVTPQKELHTLYTRQQSLHVCRFQMICYHRQYSCACDVVFDVFWLHRNPLARVRIQHKASLSGVPVPAPRDSVLRTVRLGAVLWVILGNRKNNLPPRYIVVNTSKLTGQ